MRINKVRIMNIYPFDNALADFTIEGSPAKLVVVLGENGTGKTTLLKASLIAAISEDYSTITRRLGNRVDGGRIDLIVEVAGKIYKLNRSLKKRSGVTRIAVVEDGKDRSLRNLDEYFDLVKSKYVEAIKALSFYSVAENTLIEASKDLSEFILDVIGASRLIEFLKSLGSAARTYKKRLEGEKLSISRQRSRLTNEIYARKRELERLSIELERIDKRLKAISPKLEESEKSYKKLLQELSKLEAEINELLKDIEEYNSLQAKISRISPKIAEKLADVDFREAKEFLRFGGLKTIRKMNSILARAGVESLEELKKLKPENIEELREKEKSLNAQLSSLKAELASITRQLESLEEKRSRIKAEIDEIARKFETIGCSAGEPELMEMCYEKKLEEKKKLLEDAKAKRLNVMACIRLIFGNIGNYRCPICGRSLSDEEINRLRKQLEEERLALEDQLSRQIRDLERHVKALERLGSLVEKYAHLLEELKELKIESAELEKQKYALKTKIKRLEEEYRKVSEELKKAEEINELIIEAEKIEDSRRRVIEALERLGDKAKLVEEYSREIAKLDIEEDLRAIVKRINELAPRVKEFESKRTLYKELSNEVRRLEREIEALKAEKTSLERSKGQIEGRIESLKREIEERTKLLRELDSKIQKIERAMRLLDNLSRELSHKAKGTIIEKFRTNVLADSINNINKKLRQLIEIVNSSAGIKRKTIRIELDKDKVIIKAKRYEDVNARERELRELSAGERMLASVIFMLAFRSALSLNNLPLILDEPTANADAYTREKVIELVKHFLRNNVVPQVFIATHDAELKDMLENIEGVKILKLEKNGEYTEIKDLAPQ